MGKGIVKIFVGIIIGIVVAVLALGGGLYYLLTMKGTMGKIEESGIGESLSLEFDDEQKEMSILAYAQAVIGAVADLSGKPIGDIEKLIGTHKLSETISDAVGIAPETVRTSSIGDLGKTISANLTVNVMSDKFAIALPEDIPLFASEEFLSQPISEAFGDLSAYTMDNFVTVVYDEEATAENPASSKLMQKIGKKPLSEVSSDMDAIIQDTTIGEVIEVDEATASPVMKYLKDWKIGDLDKAEELDEHGNPIPGTGGALQNMKISDAVEITDESAPVLRYFRDNETKLDEIDAALKTMTIGDAVEIYEEDVYAEDGVTVLHAKSSNVLIYLKDKKLDELDEAIKSMKISDAVEVYEEDVYDEDGVTLLHPKSHAVIIAIKDLTLDELGKKDALQAKIDTVKLGEVITVTDDSEPVLKALKDTELGNLNEKVSTLLLKEVITVTDDSEPILKALKDTKLNEINARIAELTVREIFRDYDTGILSLVDPDTKINAIESALRTSVADATIYALMQTGLFEYTINGGDNTKAGYVKKTNIHNADIKAVVTAFGYGNFDSVANPIIYLYAGSVTDTAYAAAANTAGARTVDISALGTLDENGYYLLTPEVVTDILTAGDGTVEYGASIWVDDGLKLKLSDGSANYENLFSLVYDEDASGEIAFADTASFVNEKGGYAYFYCPAITVNGVAYNGANGPEITFKTVKKDSATVNANTLIELATAYEPAP